MRPGVCDYCDSHDSPVATRLFQYKNRGNASMALSKRSYFHYSARELDACPWTCKSHVPHFFCPSLACLSHEPPRYSADICKQRSPTRQ